MIRYCPKDDTLGAFLDGALPHLKMVRVRKHVQVCHKCRSRLATMDHQYEQMDEMIRNLPEIQPSPMFDHTFWFKVDKLEEKRSRPKWFQSIFYHWRPAMAAGVTLGLVAAFLIFRPNLPAPSFEDMFIADHMEMLDEFEMLERLDLYENWEAIQRMKEQG